MAGAMGVKATMWIMAGVVMLLCGMSAGSAQAMSGEGVHARVLLQKKESKIVITDENVKDFVKLVEDAKNGTDVVIAVPSIHLSKPLEIKTSITLRGQDPEKRPRIDCKRDEAWITVSSTDVILEDFILSKCKGPALRIANEAFADPFANPEDLEGIPFLITHILHVDFFDNQDKESGFNADGGAIGVSGGSNVTVVDCLFRNNFAQLGGGIHVQSPGLLHVEQSDFIRNEAVISGAAISSTVQFTEQDGPSTSFVVMDCNFIENKDLDGVADSSGLQLQQVGSSLETSEFLHFDAPQASGGAIYVVGFNNVLISDCTFDANSAVPAGGALFVGDNDDVHLLNNKFLSNHVHSSLKEDRRSDLELGGGAYVSFVSQKSKIKIESCTFENNTASYGGGLHIVTPLSTQPAITNCVFESNTAHIGGGGLVLRNTIQALVENMLMKNNTAAAGGGLLLTNGAGVSFIQGYDKGTDSKFLDNRAYDGGAWFFLGPGQVMCQAVVLARNHAVRNGGGAYLVESLASGGVIFQDSEIIDNSAARGGGIFMSSIVRLDIRHSFDNFNTFRGNKAGAGGALYLRPSSEIDNNIKISDSVFEDNKALLKYEHLQSDILPIFDDETNDETTMGRRLLQNILRTKNNLSSKGEANVLKEKSDDPCFPGGGGAICLVLNQVPDRARVNVHIMSSSFSSNSANTGGAIFIATAPESSWLQHCPMSSAALSTTPCRGLGIQKSEFEGNSARGAGGALFMTHSETVHFDTEGVDGPPRTLVPFSTLGKGKFGNITNNAVGHRGYGADVATGATHMMITTSLGDNDPNIISEHHISGTKLPVIKLAVVDTYKQVVSAGVSDSVLKVQAISEHIAGQLVSVAENGIVTFDALTFTADPGTYSLIFLADDLPPVRSSVTIRSCIIGEFNVTDQKICTNCSAGFFGLDPMVPCQQCHESAECTGGPVLVPRDGHWHSTPYSPQIHTCLSSEACSYDGRLDVLRTFYDDLHSLEPGNVLLSNFEYPQCSKGYENVLCGSCSKGFGHFEGGECVKCKSKKLTSLFIFLVALWSLALLGFTIRSSLSAIRDFNEMRTILARKAQAQATTSQPVSGTAPHPIASSTPNGGNMFYNQQDAAGNGNPGKEIQQCKTPVSSAELKSEQSTASIDHIIAAENLAETLKIAVNFLQVTSVALAINADWSDAIEKTLAVQDVLAGFSNGASLIAIDCLLDYEGSIPISIRALVVRLAFPIVLLVIVVAIFFAYWIYLYHKKKEPLSYFRSRTIISSLVVLFFAYEFITQELMRIMNCVDIDVDHPEGSGQSYSEYSIAKGRYWGEDTSLKCYEGSHARLVGSLGGPGLIIFSLGIPLFVLVFLLWNKENNKLNDQLFLNTYGFIFQNYNERFVYWEVLIMFRKALVDGIVVFAYPLGPNLQGVLALGVLIVSLVLHLVALPYKYRVLNLLEGASLVVSIFMFYSGIVFNDKNTSEVARVFLSTLLIVINLGLVVLFVVRGFQQVDKFLVAKLKCFQVSVPRGFFPRAYKFCLITVTQAAEEVQKQSKNHPLVKGMSQSIRHFQTKSARFGKSVSRRMGKLGTSVSGRSLASTRSARSLESQNSLRSGGIGTVARTVTELGGIPEFNGIV